MLTRPPCAGRRAVRDAEPVLVCARQPGRARLHLGDRQGAGPHAGAHQTASHPWYSVSGTGQDGRATTSCTLRIARAGSVTILSSQAPGPTGGGVCVVKLRLRAQHEAAVQRKGPRRTASQPVRVYQEGAPFLMLSSTGALAPCHVGCRP